MLIPFRKMQAQGNDFAILELTATTECHLPLAELAKDICDRRKGVGADGLVALLADKEADARMIIFNADGSRAAMCGSALRCCAFILDGLLQKSELNIATDSGIKAASVIETEDAQLVEVNLGKPLLLEEDILVMDVNGCLIDVGNQHFVSYWERLSGQELEYGHRLEKHPYFAEGTNSEFVRVISRGEIEMKVWEKGVGATQACGTGAAASVFTGIRKGLLDSDVRVHMPGGEVRIRQQKNGEYLLAGGVENVFSGVYRWRT